MQTFTCSHCGETFQAHPNARLKYSYCTKAACQRAKCNMMVKARRERLNLKTRHCKQCNKSFEVDRDDTVTYLCKHCQTVDPNKDNKCECCGVNDKHPGFMFLCWDCYINDGLSDEAHRKETLDWRYF